MSMAADIMLVDNALMRLRSPSEDFKSLNGFPSEKSVGSKDAGSKIDRSSATKKRKESCRKEECVSVVVRCRPMSAKEKSMNYLPVIEMWPDQGTILIRNPRHDHKDPVKTFTFDAVYDWNSKQSDLYDEMVRPLVESVLNGFNATIFAYGQTGTGKTYTMEGCKKTNSSSSTGDDNDDERGVIPKSFEQIFTHISRTTDKQHLVRTSYLEIYQEEIRDLLDKDPKKRYELKENKDIGVYVKGLRSFVCKNVKEIEHVMNIGNRNRTIGATNMNEHSSRSHAIFMITVEMSDLSVTKGLVRVGKLNLVDLAGSERQAKTGATGDRLKEASKINLSLSALGNVISALVDEKCQYIPYRDSKLTRLLQDSLGGNSKTLMVANIGPASYNYDESLTTLRYANRAKNIQNQPRINEDPKDALIRQYQEEIERLKTILTERTTQSNKKGALNWEEQEEREQAEFEQKKATILLKNDQTEEEKARQLKILEEKRKMVEEERKYSAELSVKIKSMESKLLQGGKNIIDHTNEQQKALEKRMFEIRERKQQHLQMQKRLEEVEESAENIKISYSNLLEEVEAKRKLLSKITAKCQRVKQEISDSAEEHNQNRRDLENSQKHILKEIKLNRLIIDNFIPLDERKSIEDRLVYDDDDNSWRVLPDDNISYSLGRLVANPAYRRPTCEYTKALIKEKKFHVGGENILLLELEPLPRTTKDYEGTAIPSSLKLMLQTALKEEEDIEIDAAPNKSRSSSRVRDRSRSSSAVRATPGIVRNGKYYPQPRGLVPK